MDSKPAENRRDDFLPFHVPDIGEEEIAAVADTLRSGWLTTGPRVKKFEEAFAAFVDARHAVAVNSCTAALHLALEAIHLQPGDEVIVPTVTFAATGEVVTYFGARPVLVDCERDSLNVDLKCIESAITPRTKAIIPVHFAGRVCAMDEIVALANAHGLKVIEDAAHSLPSRLGEQHAGTFGDIGCFSFYATKTLTTGEGGMLVTDDAEYADRARIMSLHGISKDAWKRYTAAGSWYYEISAPGYKYNMTDTAAALGLVQLRRCEELTEIRRRYAAIYDAAFGEVPEVAPLADASMPGHAWHLYVIRLDLDRLTISREEFINLLREMNIGTSVHFIPLHLHPYYREKYGYQPSDCPVASASYERIISLPLYSRMKPQDVEYVADCVAAIVERHRR